MNDRSKWQVVLYNEINKKEFCSCCIFNQCLIIQCQISSGASRWKHNSYRSWTLYGTCYFLMYRLVIVSHNINSTLMITRNVLLAWNAIEYVFFLVCWSNRELSCPRFLILIFIWLLFQLGFEGRCLWSSVLELWDDSVEEKTKWHASTIFGLGARA